MKQKNYFFILSAVAVAIFCLTTSVAFMAGTEPQPGVISVGVNDLKSAGFGDVKVQAPSGTAFSEPVKYFRVKETVIKVNPEWAAAANVVAVMIMPRHDDWLYNEGKLETIELAGRTQLRASKPGYYFVVTGPDSKKAAALMSILLSK